MLFRGCNEVLLLLLLLLSLLLLLLNELVIHGQLVDS